MSKKKKKFEKYGNKFSSRPFLAHPASGQETTFYLRVAWWKYNSPSTITRRHGFLGDNRVAPFHDIVFLSLGRLLFLLLLQLFIVGTHARVVHLLGHSLPTSRLWFGPRRLFLQLIIQRLLINWYDVGSWDPIYYRYFIFVDQVEILQFYTQDLVK